MRNPFVLALTTIAQVVGAQTFFYINSIAVLPPAATPADEVSIELAGDLASTGAYVVSASATVNAGEVVISIVADDAGGFAVLVPHIEVIDLGLLPAGLYTISFNLTNAADPAPPEQHHFAVTQMGASCDSLMVEGPWWHPFTDTALVVRANHYLLPDTLFGPSFTLVNGDLDTAGTEPSPYPFMPRFVQQWHTLVPDNEHGPDGTSFEGALLFNSTDHGSVSCARLGPFDLCHPGSCQQIQPVIQNLGGGITENTFAWNIIDPDGDVAATGTFALNGDQQADTGYTCLAPGAYTLVVALVDEPTAGQPWAGLAAEGISGPLSPLSWTDPLVLPFVFHPVCAGIALSLPKYTPATVRAWSDGTVLHIRSNDLKPLGVVTVLDATGRLVTRVSGRSNTVAIPIMQRAPNVLVISTDQGTVKVCVIPD